MAELKRLGFEQFAAASTAKKAKADNGDGNASDAEDTGEDADMVRGYASCARAVSSCVPCGGKSFAQCMPALAGLNFSKYCSRLGSCHVQDSARLLLPEALCTELAAQVCVLCMGCGMLSVP